MAKRIRSIEGCGRPAKARGWCNRCYLRWWKHDDPTATETPGRGSRRWITGGYVKVYRPDHPTADGQGYALEHRAVAYDAGLLTDLTDIVHHRDGDKQNNTVANLEVMSRAKHFEVHDAEGVGFAAWNRAKTHCPYGHPYDESNTYVIPSSGKRWCRTCMKEWRLRDAARRARTS